MNSTIKMLFLFITFFAATNIVDAQKIGYVNSQALLAELNEVKQARSSLETFQKQLQSKGQKMLETFQAEYKRIAAKVENGELSPKQQEEEGQKLKDKETEIAKYEADMQKQIVQKEQTLLKPILDRVNQAIEDVAKADGYQFILDASQGSIIYADDSADITPKVKSKLGI